MYHYATRRTHMSQSETAMHLKKKKSILFQVTSTTAFQRRATLSIELIKKQADKRAIRN